MQAEINKLKLQNIADNFNSSVTGLKHSLLSKPESVQTNYDLVIALLPYIAGTLCLALAFYFGPSLILQIGKAAGSAVTEITTAIAKAATAAVNTAFKNQSVASMTDLNGNTAEVIITGQEFVVYVTLASTKTKLLHPIIDAHMLLHSLEPCIGIEPEVAQVVVNKLFGSE